MLSKRCMVGVVMIGASAALVGGCASGESATVRFSYDVQPTKGLPPGLHVVTIQPAAIGATTDPKWSELSVSLMQSIVNDSRDRFGVDIVVSDRRDPNITFDNADMVAAGMMSDTGARGELLGAQGAILASINVKKDVKKGKQTTISNIFAAGGGGRGVGGGAFDLDTREVETVTRSLTVQTEFKLLDGTNNRVWDYWAPDPFRSTERTKASPIFGSSKTEAELTPEDRIVGELVQRGCRAFLSRLIPVRVRAEARITASTNANCAAGVRLLRAEAYAEALSSFKTALAEKPGDDAAAFGAGLACEAMGNLDDALSYYRRAIAGRSNPEYFEARERAKLYVGRVQ